MPKYLTTADAIILSSACFGSVYVIGTGLRLLEHFSVNCNTPRYINIAGQIVVGLSVATYVTCTIKALNLI